MQASIAKGPLILYITSFFVTFIVKKFNKVIGDKVRIDSIAAHSLAELMFECMYREFQIFYVLYEIQQFVQSAFFTLATFTKLYTDIL